MFQWQNPTPEEGKLLKALLVLFRKDPQLLCFLLDRKKPRLRNSIEKLLELSEECFTCQQDVLFRIGMDMWSGSGDTRVWELIEFLGFDRLKLVLEAIEYLGTKSEGWNTPVICRQLKFPSDNSRRQLNLDS